MNYCDISLLYVEDELVLRSIYHKILEDKVKQIYLAEDGEEAFNLYKEHQPDLIITDIKMPVMNGLDLARKIRADNPNARIIIMSAYGESHYFMRAIENGVKGFLLKPVDTERLFQTIDEQAREILMERNVQIETQKRKIVENELFRNEKVLQTVSDAAELILYYGFNRQIINKILSQFGQSTEVSRVYIFENYIENDSIFCNQTHEWAAENIHPQIDNPDLHGVQLSDSPFSRWIEILGKHHIISGAIKEFSQFEREMLEQQDIVSVLIVPIFVNNIWYGFIGFDDCINERTWTAVETNAIITAANIIGTAIHREQIEAELKQLNQDLEKRVFERTRELEYEIAEKNIAESLLRDSEEKYRLIFEKGNDGILLSRNKVIRFINPKAYEITGFLPKEMIGHSFEDFIHEDFKQLAINNYNSRIDGQDTPATYDIQIITASGKTKWVEIESNVLKWDGKPSLLTFITDIQSRKDVENELRELNLHLEDRVKQEFKQIAMQQELLIQKNKLESLGELSAGISHEINQPLGGVSFSLDNILHELDSGLLTNDYLKTKINLIFSDIERIQKIIDHVRVFSRDNQEINYETVEINSVVENSVSLVLHHYTNNNIFIRLHLCSEPLYIFGSPFQLEQVLLNMFSNSKFALERKSANGQLNFEKYIEITSKLENQHIILELTDNGIGISTNIITRIFDPFFTSKPAAEGTGLGLSISYGIINRMKGKIDVESVENEYTKFTISIPVNS